ncbi:hypothetical protein [Candidatus Neptunochlamydia vexilliferae]|nr:hypothetical protein [Candidatus Neptunochlamydia vexilliferae]
MKKFLMLALPIFSLFSYSVFADEDVNTDGDDETVVVEETTEDNKEDKNA